MRTVEKFEEIFQYLLYCHVSSITYVDNDIFVLFWDIAYHGLVRRCTPYYTLK